MWDAFTGELRCTYRGYDDVDEVESAISVIFSNDGQKVLGGYKKSIKQFDTNVYVDRFKLIFMFLIYTFLVLVEIAIIFQ